MAEEDVKDILPEELEDHLEDIADDQAVSEAVEEAEGISEDVVASMEGDDETQENQESEDVSNEEEIQEEDGENEKIILNLAGELSQELRDICQQEEYSIYNFGEELGSRQPEKIFVRHHLGSYSNLDEKYNTIMKDVSIISLSSVDSKVDFFGVNGKACIFEGALQNKLANKVIRRLFTKRSSLQIEEMYDALLTENNSLKLSGHMDVGYYGDIVAQEAAIKDYNFISIRNFFIGVVSYLAYLKKGEIAEFPIEVDFGEGSDAFIVQLYAPVQNFVTEYIWESFFTENGKNPFRGLLKRSLSVCDLLDIYYLEKSSKVVLTGVWLKNSDVKNEDYFPTMLINNIDAFEHVEKRWEEYKKTPNVVVEKISAVEETADLESKEIPGDAVDLKSKNVGTLHNNQELLQKLVNYIMDLRRQEASPKEVVTLSVTDIDVYLYDYPEKEEIQHLNDIDKQLIIDCLEDDDNTMVDSLMDTIENIQVFKADEPEEEEIHVFKQDEPEEEEIHVFKQDEPEEEEITVIKADEPEEEEEVHVFKQDEPEEEEVIYKEEKSEETLDSLREEWEVKTLEKEEEEKEMALDEEEVKVFKAEKPKEEEEDDKVVFKKEEEEKKPDWEVKELQPQLQVKSGFNRELWQEKKHELALKIDKLRESGRNFKEIEDEFTNILSEELEMEKDDARVFAKGILDNAITSAHKQSMDEKIREAKSQITKVKMDAETRKNEEAQRFRDDIQKRDQQILKMKNVINSMKAEVEAARKAEKALQKVQDRIAEQAGAGNIDPESMEDPDNLDNLKLTIGTLKGEISELCRESKKKDTEIQNAKDAQKIALDNFDRERARLQGRIDDMAAKALDEKKVDNREDLIKLQAENRSLNSLVEVSNRRIATMNEKIESLKKQSSSKSDTEVKILKEKFSKLHSEMKKLLTENKEFEIKYKNGVREIQILNKKYSDLQRKSGGGSGDDAKKIKELDQNLRDAKIENGTLKQELKQAELKTKQLDHKLKLTTEQLKAAEKRQKSVQVEESKDTSKASDLQVKQLTITNQKLTTQANKMKEELAARKKELIKYKSDFNVIKNKLETAERKIVTLNAKLKHKAA